MKRKAIEIKSYQQLLKNIIIDNFLQLLECHFDKVELDIQKNANRFKKIVKKDKDLIKQKNQTFEFRPPYSESATAAELGDERPIKVYLHNTFL